ncbi:hypothetical protein GK047_14055 [Paenibacillus sp. SYP-B3998]|uniref:Uncharacterized protein n=1 Tax=Paenibacillus sp. SYP-B3998 TaxID=2678564 RepID=A0A6G4A0F3_9BACL|nr:hypothetical protein [Paenibacillus sp. SYP-B3998]NEW07127.1 hypothetical protein [Paenibacillus sp. SYP-B3998]
MLVCIQKRLAVIFLAITLLLSWLLPTRVLAVEEPTIQWGAPLSTQLVSTTFYVDATIHSTGRYIATIEVEGHLFPLHVNKWAWWAVGIVSLAGQERGVKKLTLRVAFDSGKVVEQVRYVIYDLEPTITITSPLPSTSTSGDVLLQASCRDDGSRGCVELKVTAATSYKYKVLATAEREINQIVSLAAFRGERVTLIFEGKDNTGQVTRKERTIFVVR